MKKVRKLLTTYQNMSIEVKASAWYIICNFLQKGIAFLVVPIYTRVLSTEQYGMYTVFQSWLNILIIFATLNLYAGVYTKALVQYEKSRDQYTSAIQSLSSLITTFLFVIYIVFQDDVNGLLGMPTKYLLLSFVYFYFFPSFSFWSVRQRVENKYQSMVIVTLLSVILMPVLSLTMLNFLEYKQDALICGYVLSQALFGVYFYIDIIKKGKTVFNKEYWATAVKFNIPLIPHYLSLIVLGQADRIMIDKMCGASEVAFYNLAYQVSMVITVIVNGIQSALTPWMYKKMKERDYNSLGNISNSTVILVMVGIVLIEIFGPEFIYILGGGEYAHAKWVIPAVATSVYFVFWYGLFSNIEFYFGKTIFIMFASVIGAIVNIVLNGICIPYFGYIAAAYTTLICYFVMMIAHYIFAKKMFTDNTMSKFPYGLSRVLYSTLFMFAIMIMVTFSYNSIWGRFVVCIIAIVAIWLMRKRIISYIKNFVEIKEK